MLNREKDGLEIFDNFQIDQTLPKHKEKSSSTPNSSSFGPMAMGGTFNFGPDGDTPMPKRKGFFRRLIDWSVPKMSVHQFFKEVKFALKDIPKYEHRINDYLSAVEYAKKNGQTALKEALEMEVQIVKNETILRDGGFDMVITEEQIVKFYKESDKALAMTYIKNFARLIPSDVSKRKDEADILKVFDAYVVLSYDPHGKSFKMTEAEIIKKKDPILFGLIKGVRKLYFIADWKDEFCDLQLSDFINKFGEEAINANNITVNYKRQ
jgi:hypothetical protein